MNKNHCSNWIFLKWLKAIHRKKKKEETPMYWSWNLKLFELEKDPSVVEWLLLLLGVVKYYWTQMWTIHRQFTRSSFSQPGISVRFGSVLAWTSVPTYQTWPICHTNRISYHEKTCFAFKSLCVLALENYGLFWTDPVIDGLWKVTLVGAFALLPHNFGKETGT